MAGSASGWAASRWPSWAWSTSPAGCPTPAEGHGVPLREGGGYLGYLVSSPLVSAVSTYVAVPLLVLVLVFGLLVVTATPLHALPDRARRCSPG